jgi:hypothetical protein
MIFSSGCMARAYATSNPRPPKEAVAIPLLPKELSRAQKLLPVTQTPLPFLSGHKPDPHAEIIIERIRHVAALYILDKFTLSYRYC